MLDARIALLCDAPVSLTPAVLAMQPCAIGVADMGNRFVLSFMERPDSAANGFLFLWLDGLCAG